MTKHLKNHPNSMDCSTGMTSVCYTIQLFIRMQSSAAEKMQNTITPNNITEVNTNC